MSTERVEKNAPRDGMCVVCVKCRDVSIKPSFNVISRDFIFD